MDIAQHLTDARPQHSLPRPSRWWLWAVAALCAVAALVAVLRLFVFSSTGQALEYATFAPVQAYMDAETTRSTLSRILALLPAVGLILAGAATLAIAAVRQRLAPAVAVVVAVVGANVTTQALKALLDRPVFDNAVPYLAGNSAPSGHTTLAASAAVALLLAASPRWRGPAAVLGALFTILVGVAAYLEAWHRPADMVAAALVAVAWGFIAAPWVQRWDRPVAPAHRLTCHTASGAEALLWTAGTLVTVAAVVAMAVIAMRLPQGHTPGTAVAVGTGIALASGPAALAFATLLTGLRRELRWQRRRARPAALLADGFETGPAVPIDARAPEAQAPEAQPQPPARPNWPPPDRSDLSQR
ncbi:MAG: phosphatase PAP2 family protein [Micrococcus sp.]|nr:phosphatase PAP2 family protein [Micrococcus sp.]